MFANRKPDDARTRRPDTRFAHAREDCWKVERDLLRRQFATLSDKLRGR